LPAASSAHRSGSAATVQSTPSARRARRLNASDATQVIGFLRDFADRTHHLKEDDCLANVVHREFSGEDLVRLTEEFDEIERREIDEGTFERFVALVEALEAKHRDGGPPA
jgi:hemerythrin-like domain-containing protein